MDLQSETTHAFFVLALTLILALALSITLTLSLSTNFNPNPKITRILTLHRSLIRTRTLPEPYSFLLSSSPCNPSPKSNPNCNPNSIILTRLPPNPHSTLQGLQQRDHTARNTMVDRLDTGLVLFLSTPRLSPVFVFFFSFFFFFFCICLPLFSLLVSLVSCLVSSSFVLCLLSLSCRLLPCSAPS